jgi:hypothetical protein
MITERDDTIERLAANSGQGHWAVGTSPPSVSSEDDEENIAMLMSVCESNRESARKALWKCCGGKEIHYLNKKFYSTIK